MSKNTTYISIQNIILHHIYYFLLIYIHSSCLHLFWQVFETPCPTKHGMVINLLLYSRESKGLAGCCNQLVFQLYYSKRAPTTIHSITHVLLSQKHWWCIWGYNNRVVHSSTIISCIIFHFHKIIQKWWKHILPSIHLKIL